MIDKQQVRKAFSQSALHYDQVAVLQKEMGNRMLERLDYVKLQPEVILDVGAGTGHCSHELLKRYKKSKVIALDFALPMLAETAKKGRWLRRPDCLCADMESLPLADQSVDLIFSNAAIQWSTDINQVFMEFMRVLKPNGLLMFTSFGPDTLKELRTAWSEVDQTPHTSHFIDLHDLGDALLNVQFSDPVMDAERMTLTYETVNDLVKDLKILGAHNVVSDRQKGLTGKQRWQGMFRAYEQFRQEDRLPATYEIIYGHAWRAEVLKKREATSIEIHVPIDRIGR